MKEKVSNVPSLRARRRMLRNNPTPQEVILWSRLKDEQLGYKFRRQHSFGGYIADFYCPRKKLIIEIDGSQHIDQKEYDAERTKFFEKQGCRVLRFWNNEINTNLNGIAARIIEFLDR